MMFLITIIHVVSGISENKCLCKLAKAPFMHEMDGTVHEFLLNSLGNAILNQMQMVPCESNG